MSNVKPALSKVLANTNAITIDSRPPTFKYLHVQEEQENANAFQLVMNFIKQQPVSELSRLFSSTGILGKCLSEHVKSDEDGSKITVLYFIQLGGSVATHNVITKADGTVDIWDFEEQKNWQNGAEWAYELFKIHFKKEAKEALVDFVNEAFDQQFVLQEENQNTVSVVTPYQQDDIYHFLNHLLNQEPVDVPSFYLNGLGKIEQTPKRDAWVLLTGGFEYTLEINNLLHFVQIVSKHLSQGNENIQERVFNKLMRINTNLKFEQIEAQDITTNVTASNDEENEFDINDFLPKEINLDDAPPPSEYWEYLENNPEAMKELADSMPELDHNDSDNSYYLDALAEEFEANRTGVIPTQHMPDAQYWEDDDIDTPLQQPVQHDSNIMEPIQVDSNIMPANDNHYQASIDEYKGTTYDNSNANQDDTDANWLDSENGLWYNKPSKSLPLQGQNMNNTTWNELNNLPYSIADFLDYSYNNGIKFSPKSHNGSGVYTFINRNHVETHVEVRDNQICFLNNPSELLSIAEFYPRLFETMGVEPENYKNALLNVMLEENMIERVTEFSKMKRIRTYVQSKSTPFDDLYLEDIFNIIYAEKIVPITPSGEIVKGRMNYLVSNGVSFRIKGNDWLYQTKSNPTPVVFLANKDTDVKTKFMSFLAQYNDTSAEQLIDEFNYHHWNIEIQYIMEQPDWEAIINQPINHEEMDEFDTFGVQTQEYNDVEIVQSNITESQVPTAQEPEHNSDGYDAGTASAVSNKLIHESVPNNDEHHTDDNNVEPEPTSSNVIQEETPIDEVDTSVKEQPTSDLIDINAQTATLPAQDDFVSESDDIIANTPRPSEPDKSITPNEYQQENSTTHQEPEIDNHVNDNSLEEPDFFKDIPPPDDEYLSSATSDNAFAMESADNHIDVEPNNDINPTNHVTEHVNDNQTVATVNNDVQVDDKNNQTVVYTEAENVVDTEQIVEKPSVVHTTQAVVQTAQEVVQQQIEKTINKEVTMDSLQELVEAKKQEYLGRLKRICNTFQLMSFLELCASDNNPTQLKVQRDGDVFYVGKSQEVVDMADPSNRKQKTSDFLKAIILKNKPDASADFVDNWLSKIDKQLEPELERRIKQQLSLEVAENVNKLVIEEKNRVAVQNDIAPIASPSPVIEHKNEQHVEVAQPSSATENEVEQRLSEWDAMFFREGYNEIPLKRYLYEYELPMFGNERVYPALPRIIKQMVSLSQSFQNKEAHPKHIPNPEFVKEADVYPSASNNMLSSHTLKLPDGRVIKMDSWNKRESWKILQGEPVVINNQEMRSGDSLIDCLEHIVLPAYNLKLRGKVISIFHQKLGSALEEQFYYNYPKAELLSTYSSSSGPTNGGIRGESNSGMVWQVYTDDNRVRFYNGGSADHIQNTELVASLIYISSKRGDSWKSYCTNDYETWRQLRAEMPELREEARNMIKDHFLGMNNLTRKMMFESGTQAQSKNNSKFTEEDFHKLAPMITPEGTAIARKYLIEDRFVNPYALDAHINKVWGGGLYNYNKRSLYDDRNLSLDDYVNVALFFNAEHTSIAVRGASKVGTASQVKEQVPGSHGHPIVFEPNSLYDYIDSKDENKKRLTVAYCESAIDALSFQSLYPDALVVSMSGANINDLVRSLKEMEVFITPKELEEGHLQYVFAMDNTELDADNNAVDPTSRANYFKVFDEMGTHCWKQFYLHNKDLIESTGSQSPLDIVSNIFESKYTPEQIEFANRSINDYMTSGQNNIVSWEHSGFQRIIGKILFQFEYVDKGWFKLMTPSHPEIKQVKDWNALLEELVKLRTEQNPHLSLQEVHDLITHEHTPYMLHKSVLKQRKQELKTATDNDVEDYASKPSMKP